jgi:hypothetical protein
VKILHETCSRRWQPAEVICRKMELTLVPKRYFRAMSPEGSGHKMRERSWEQTERIVKHMTLVDGARSGSWGASLAAEAPLAESRGRLICGTSSRSNTPAYGLVRR